MVPKPAMAFVVVLFVGCQFLIFISYSGTFRPGKAIGITTCSCKSDTPPVTHFIENPAEMILNTWVVDAIMHPMQTKSEIDFLLRLRGLVLVSIREVNLRIRNEQCERWWVNPLSVNRVKEKVVSRTVKQYTLTFEAQPGRIPFETVLHLRENQRNSTALFVSDDFIFISGRRLDALPTKCGSVHKDFHQMCLCPEEKTKAEKRTLEIRHKWNRTDPELLTWRPYVSMMVPDYLIYNTMDLYLRHPSTDTEFCGTTIKMLIFVSSAPFHTAERLMIRETYGNQEFLKQNNVQLLFVFDRIKNSTLQDEIDNEVATYDDIIQGNYDHSYHNLTFRPLAMYNWLATHCKDKGSHMPRWVMKVDDDYFINIPLALRVVAANPEVEIMGCQNCGQPSVRDIAYMDKYYVPRYMHLPEKYAGYLSGASYFLRSDIIPALLKASLTTPLLHMEDAYVTGVLTKEIGIYPRYSRLISYDREGPGPCITKTFVNSNTLNASDMLLHWENFRQPVPTKCRFDDSLLKVDRLTRLTKHFCYFE